MDKPDHIPHLKYIFIEKVKHPHEVHKPIPVIHKIEDYRPPEKRPA